MKRRCEYDLTPQQCYKKQKTKIELINYLVLEIERLKQLINGMNIKIDNLQNIKKQRPNYSHLYIS